MRIIANTVFLVLISILYSCPGSDILIDNEPDKDYVPLSSLQFYMADIQEELDPNSVALHNLIFTPHNATNKEVTISVANESIISAKYDDEQIIVRTLSTGNTRITVTSKDNANLSVDIPVLVTDDITRPQLMGISTLDNTILHIVFNEIISTSDLMDKANYTVTRGFDNLTIDTLEKSSVEGQFISQVSIKLVEALSIGDEIIIGVNNVKDLSGNIINNQYNLSSITLIDPISCSFDLSKITETSGMMVFHSGFATIVDIEDYNDIKLYVVAAGQDLIPDNVIGFTDYLTNGDNMSLLSYPNNNSLKLNNGDYDIYVGAIHSVNGGMMSYPVTYTITTGL